MPRATRHEANSPGREIRPMPSIKRGSPPLSVAAWRPRLFRSAKRLRKTRFSPRRSGHHLRRQKRLTPALRPRLCRIRLFRRMINRTPPPRMLPSVRWGAARTHIASGIALRYAHLTMIERSCWLIWIAVSKPYNLHSSSRCRDLPIPCQPSSSSSSSTSSFLWPKGHFRGEFGV